MAGTPQYYRYDPSLVAGAIFLGIFALSSLVHTWQLFRHRSWYFIPFLLGCLCEAIGCLGRVINAEETPNWTKPPYIIQALLLLLGPLFFAASIYMILGRFIRFLDAEKHSLIRTTWVTKFFLLGDILSLLAQGAGASQLVNAKTKKDQDRAQTIILVGLAVQIIFFGLFMIVIAIFHFRINRHPTPTSRNILVPWRRLLYILYATSFLILIRSIFRVAEYVMGHDGELQAKEVYLYVLDILPMAGVAIVFNAYHPSTILNGKGKGDGAIGATDSEMQLGDYRRASDSETQYDNYQPRPQTHTRPARYRNRD